MSVDPTHELLQAIEDRRWPAALALAARLENLTHERERRAVSGADAPPWAPGTPATGGQTFLVTGAAGFIGSHVTRRLLEAGHVVIGFDQFNDYYDPVFKWENVAPLLAHPRFALHQGDLRDRAALRDVFAQHRIDQIIHLAARAGVRPSIQDPQLYVTVNVLGTQNLLDLARDHQVRNFVYASSSSVYGGNTEFPFTEAQNVDGPVSPYAATKKANELQAACFNRLYGFPVTGLRFFTVYGPSGRPDMAIRSFTERMDQGKPIPMFGDGGFERDFTYVDDVVAGILGAVRAAEGQQGWREVFNLGESDTTSVRELILIIAAELGKLSLRKPPKELPEQEQRALIDDLVKRGLVERKPEQPGDVPKTYADVTRARERLGYDPQTPIAEGIRKTVAWHRERQAAAADPEHERLRRAIRTCSAGQLRRGLDSEGRWPDPEWTAADADAFAAALREADAVLARSPHDLLALRIRAGLLALAGEAAAYLGGVARGQVRGLCGLSVHRNRRRMIALLRAGGFGGIPPAEEAELLDLARAVVRKTGERPMALVVASAGYGSRIAAEVGGTDMKHRLFLGDEMVLLSLRNFLPHARRVVMVVSERNRDDVAALLARSELTEDQGFQVDYVVQRERLGDGDAHLCAAQILSGFDGVVLFLFADAPTKSPETIGKMALLAQALGEVAPLVVPCLEEEKPYSPIVLARSGPDRGRVIWNWQKADEADYPAAVAARQGRALRNVGIFAAEASVFPALQRFKDEVFAQSGRYLAWKEKRDAWVKAGQPAAGKPKEPEFGFADLMKVLPPEGWEVAAPCLAGPADRLNVNKHEDADAVKRLYRDRHPFCLPVIERLEARREVIVRCYDLAPDRTPFRVSGLPSVRNFTRLRFPGAAGLDAPEVREAVERHLRELGQRIQQELGLTVLPPVEAGSAGDPARGS
jgi:UDP-glucuronate 4-epimerase